MELAVLIADPSDILRAGLRLILMNDKRVTQIHEAATKEELHTQLRTKSLDLIVVNQSFITDMLMLPRRRFVILTAELDIDMFQRAYNHGARGYLLENTSAELLRATLCLEEKNILIEPALAAYIMDYFFSGLRFTVQDNLLSPREREVIELLREGIDRRLIAKKLHISDTTLKTHIKRIRNKNDDYYLNKKELNIK
jgi:DNA-binding NarL/FixJ family response regulator